MTAADEIRRGWTVLLGAAAGVGIGISALPFYTSGVFMKALEAEFGWSRAALSTGAFASTIILAVASPVVGTIVDRYGVRAPVAFSLASVSIGFFAMALLLDSLAGFWAIQAAMALLGAASSPIAFTRAVNGWFDKARGLALGMALTGTGLTAALAPAFVTRIIEDSGWRDGYLALGIAVAVIAPFVLLLVRLAPTQSQKPSLQPHAGHEFSDALRSSVFWKLALAFFGLAAAVGGLIVHFVPLLTDSGITPSQAAATAGLIGISVIAGRLVVGFLIDRFFAPHIAGGVLLLSATGCALLAMQGAGYAIPAAVAIGFALGAEVDLIGFLTARYFGLKAYARIYGWQYGAFLFGTGLSPLWIGAVYDVSGSYGPALWAVTAIIVCVAAVFGFLPNYPPEEEA